MKAFFRFLIIFFGIGVTTWLISFGIEAMRGNPTQPQKLSWGEDLSQGFIEQDGVRIRYIKVGNGPDLVLFHTLRTQLDIYQNVVPELRKHFTLHLVDYPGHGWSDIPKASYHPDFFYNWAEKFLEQIDVKNAVIAGISIGGTIVLELAARQNPRVAKVISINPFDYQPSYSAGLKGSSFLANIMFTATDYPFIGETFMRLRNPFLERKLFEGGVANPASLSNSLFNELSTVGARKGHYRAFINLLRERHHWQAARNTYPKIKVPVLLIYGDKDWAHEKDRMRTKQLIKGVKIKTVKNGGHFLVLDQPKILQNHIITFSKEN